jgi:D-amino peptidase
MFRPKNTLPAVLSLAIFFLAAHGVAAESYELTESDVNDLSKVNTPEISLFGIKLSDPEDKVKEKLIKIKIPGVKVEIQDVYVMLYDRRSPGNPMAGIRLSDGKVDYIFINQRFAHLASGVFRSILRGEGVEEARKLLGKEEFSEDQTTFTRLNYKGGTLVLVFSGRDITVEFNGAV